jgi:hypothetical protein
LPRELGVAVLVVDCACGKRDEVRAAAQFHQRRVDDLESVCNATFGGGASEPHRNELASLRIRKQVDFRILGQRAARRIAAPATALALHG